MYIHELLNNPEFNFNAPVRILKYLGGDETVTVFDSTVSGDIHFDLMMKSITRPDDEKHHSNQPRRRWCSRDRVRRLSSGICRRRYTLT